MWRLAALLAITLASVPLAMVSSRPVAIPVAVALLLCAAGLVLRSTPVLSAGIAIALGAYTLALLMAGGPPRLIGAAGVGVVAALLLEVGDFDARFRRVAFGPGVVGGQLRHWLIVAGTSAAFGLVLIAAAGALRGTIALRWTPVVAVVGALAALGAAALALHRAQRQPESDASR